MGVGALPARPLAATCIQLVEGREGASLWAYKRLQMNTKLTDSICDLHWGFIHRMDGRWFSELKKDCRRVIISVISVVLHALLSKPHLLSSLIVS